MSINGLAGKVAGFFSDIEELNIHYITAPRKKLFRKAMTLNKYLFVLYLISFNIFTTLLLIPVYAIIFYLFYLFTKICGKYRYKKAVILLLLLIFNVFSCAVAVFLRSLLIKILGF